MSKVLKLYFLPYTPALCPPFSLSLSPPPYPLQSKQLDKTIVALVAKLLTGNLVSICASNTSPPTHTHTPHITSTHTHIPWQAVAQFPHTSTPLPTKHPQMSPHPLGRGLLLWLLSQRQKTVGDFLVTCTHIRTLYMSQMTMM